MTPGLETAMRRMCSPRAVAIWAMLAWAAAPVFAQSNGNAPTAPVAASFDAMNALTQVFQLLQGVFKNIGISASTGVNTIIALYTIGIAIGGIKIAGGMDLVEAVIEWVKLSLLASFALAAIMQMPWLQSMTGTQGTLGQVVQSAFISLGNQVFGSGGSDGGALKAAGTFMQTIFRLLDVQLMPSELTGDWDKFVFLATNAHSAIAAVLMLFGTAVAMAVAGAIVVGEVFFALLSMDLAVAMAPLLVPWVMFKPLSFLFDAWLRTILVGGMTYVVASLIARGADAFANAMVAMSQGAFGKTGETVSFSSVAVAYSGMLLSALVFVFIAMKVNSLASTLISGSGVSGIGIAGFRQAVGGVSGAGTPIARGAQMGAGIAGRASGVLVGGAAGKALSRMPPGVQAAASAAKMQAAAAAKTARYILTGKR